MPKEKSGEIKLPSLDEIFYSQKEREEADLKKIYEIPLDLIDSFPDHPYKVRDDEDMGILMESIRDKGVITPCMVRKKQDGRYEMISGHRRKRACEMLGISTIRCEVTDLSREEATILMVDSNFQRSKVLPSEKAFAYKMRLEAISRQGARGDLTSNPLGRKLVGIESASLVGQEGGDSQTQVRRYIRLTELIPELLDIVDDGRIALRPAVELSFLPKGMQKELHETIIMEQCTPTHAQAIRMRRMADEGKLSSDVIEAIMQEEKPNQKERIVLRGDRIAALFPKNLPASRREEYVMAAMKHYGKFLERKEAAQNR